MNEVFDTAREPHERNTYARIDSALRTVPLANVPASLYPTVMARLRRLRKSVEPFQLSWLDYALLTFIAVAVALCCWFGYAYLLYIPTTPTFDWGRYADLISSTFFFATSQGFALIGLIAVIALAVTHRQRRLI